MGGQSSASVRPHIVAFLIFRICHLVWCLCVYGCCVICFVMLLSYPVLCSRVFPLRLSSNLFCFAGVIYGEQLIAHCPFLCICLDVRSYVCSSLIDPLLWIALRSAPVNTARFLVFLGERGEMGEWGRKKGRIRERGEILIKCATH